VSALKGAEMSAEIIKITRQNGVAGQLSYTAKVRYPGEDPSELTFVGSVYGGLVVMVTDAFPRGVFVKDPSRFGKLSPQWVRRFFGAE
jgi:hypothetical protein